MNLGISIINYKTKELTTNCLKSILGKKWQTKINIWLLDNGSNDGSYEYFKNNFPAINVIESKENLGFAKGQNLLLKQINDDFILLLNSDTEILDDSLDQMALFMKETSSDIATAKMLNFDDTLQPNSGDFPFGQALFNWLFNLEIFGLKSSFHRTDSEYYTKPHSVDWVTGGFMLVRKTAFDKIGFFNESYFMYLEDVEFCFRAKKLGFKIMINPEVSVKHLSGGSSENPQFRQWSQEFKNLLRFYKDNFGQGSTIMLKGLIYLSTSLRMLAFLIIGKLSVAKTYAKVIKTV